MYNVKKMHSVFSCQDSKSASLVLCCSLFDAVRSFLARFFIWCQNCRVVQKFVFLEDYQEREKKKKRKKAACLRELSSALLILYFLHFDCNAPSRLSRWQQAGGFTSGNALIATFSRTAHIKYFITSPRVSTQVWSWCKELFITFVWKNKWFFFPRVDGAISAASLGMLLDHSSAWKESGLATDVGIKWSRCDDICLGKGDVVTIMYDRPLRCQQDWDRI